MAAPTQNAGRLFFFYKYVINDCSLNLNVDINLFDTSLDDRGWRIKKPRCYSLTIFKRELALVVAVEELAVEQLNRDDSENELEQYIHNENVNDILQAVNDAIKYSFELGHSFNSFQWSEHSQHPQRLDCREILSCWWAFVTK